MKKIILILILILLTGCRTKKIITSKSTEIEQIQQMSTAKVESKVEKAEDKQQLKKTEILEQKKDNLTDFEVKGKAETGKPIEIYNIENGDTLQAIRVNGNANVHIRTKASQSDHVRKENNSESVIEKFKDFSEKIIEENNVKKRVQERKQKTKEIKVTGFQAGLWIVLALLGVVGIVIFGIYKYFK
ncbi:beta-lactamase regulating signal transducer with metallopeptidase domain [Chryseobacterium sp. PvR013]|uniref:hypothetical protein n=1 Tax=Chryseobacterium sp. PvR013 TaxID=2806595 RepID=UPI001AE70033|nr:hypothetical protein [Chryseobacterium sp. PvR013]MBP1165029.1 beta-lactamase regulating signal transducer with metallopeptidase domain [Chryseobacterium sp. PvR013]